MNSKKVGYETTEIRTDYTTGEVKEHKKSHTVAIEQEPAFIKLYLADICKLEGIKAKGNEILLKLLEHTNYNNEILLPKAIRERIENQLNLPKNVLNNHLSALCKKEILMRLGTGLYLLNPELFGRGSWKDIKEIRVQWVYNRDGRRIEKAEAKTHTQPELPFNSEIVCGEEDVA